MPIQIFVLSNQQLILILTFEKLFINKDSNCFSVDQPVD